MDEIVCQVNDGIKLIQKQGGHLFGSDAFLLSAFIRAHRDACAVELGAGSGIISLLCVNRGRFSHVDALEVQPEMADIARRNVELNAMWDRVTVRNIDLREFRGQADVVFSNPPYIKSDSGVHNPDSAKNASRREIYGGLDDFISCASRVLVYGGSFYCVWRPDRLCDLICAMRRHGIEPKRLCTVYPTPDARPCLVLCEGRRGGNEGSLFMTPPFVLKNGDDDTDDCKYVYERGEFGERFTRP